MTKSDMITFIHMLAKDKKVQVNIKGNEWVTNVEKGIINIPDYPFYYDSEVGQAIHEVGHILYTDNVKMPEGRTRQEYKECANMFEDVRINRLMCSKYPGAQKYLLAAVEAAYDYWFWKIYDDIPEYRRLLLSMAFRYLMVDAAHLNTPDQKAIITDNLTRNSFGRLADNLALCGNHEINVYPDAYSVRDEISAVKIKENYWTVVFEIESTQELLNYLARNVFEPFSTLLPPEDLNGKGKGKGEGEVDPYLYGKDGQGGSGEGEGEGKDGEGDTPFDFFRELGRGGIKAGGLSDFNPGTLHSLSSQYLPPYLRAVRQLREKDYVRFSGKHDRGRINGRHIAALCTGKDDKVFAKMETRGDNQHTAFALLVDVSGSMYTGHSEGADDRIALEDPDSRVGVALTAAYTFALACEQAHRPVAVYIFSNSRIMLKGYRERVSPDLWSERFRATGGGTCGSVNLMRVADELEKRREQHKVLVMLTDGESGACGTTHDNGEKDSTRYNQLGTAVQYTEKKGILTYGMGIQHDSVKYHFDNHHVCQQVPEVAGALNDLFVKLSK